jgi:hypothetical protein
VELGKYLSACFHQGNNLYLPASHHQSCQVKLFLFGVKNRTGGINAAELRQLLDAPNIRAHAINTDTNCPGGEQPLLSATEALFFSICD